MSAQIYDFHDNIEARKRWSDMERFNHMKGLGLVPDLGMPSDVNPFDFDAYPVIFWAPEKDPA